MFAKKILFLIAAGMLTVGGVSAEAATHHEKHPQDNKGAGGFRLSDESRRLAAKCRRDPSEENREALKRQVRRDYDRLIAEERNKHKSGKKRHEQHRHIEELLSERDRRVEEIVDRLLAPPGPDGQDKKPKPPRKKR